MKPIPLPLLLVCLFTACAPARQSPTVTATAFACAALGKVSSFKVDGFGEIGLYLPPCYERDVNSRYPVIYFLPGFGGTHDMWFDTGIAPMTDRLIQGNEMPPFLIVTTDDTYETIQAEAIVTDLIPYIDTNYRTVADRTHRAIAGGSLGGASAYMLTFQHPDLFSSAGIFGNGLVTGQEAQVAAWLQAIPEGRKPRVFLNSGEQDTWMIQQAKALIPILDQYGIQHAEVFSEGGHSGSYWLSNFPAYYRWLAEEW